jgi:DNA-directed RNA polymerase specialized sigma24 family protein
MTMDALSDDGQLAITHEQFMWLFLQSERELLRYVMVLVPNVTEARDVVQETAVAL